MKDTFERDFVLKYRKRGVSWFHIANMLKRPEATLKALYEPVAASASVHEEQAQRIRMGVG